MLRFGLAPVPQKDKMSDDILALEERIRRSIEAGESNFREFKSAFEGISGAKAWRT